MRHSNETRAAVVAALLTGQSISNVASEYKIPEGTVKGWSARLNGSKLVEPQKKEEIGELLIEYLRANLETLRLQAEMFSDKKWLAKQTASEAAVLHGVMTDKAIKLLEALSRSVDE